MSMLQSLMRWHCALISFDLNIRFYDWLHKIPNMSCLLECICCRDQSLVVKPPTHEEESKSEKYVSNSRLRCAIFMELTECWTPW